jgi:sigma-E factor negative regulatory protein RseC
VLEETGTIVALEADALWIETVQHSACGSCSARSGCGQHALGKVLATSSSVRALLSADQNEIYHVDQKVVIGVPEEIVTRGALIVYLTPLLSMLLMAVLANSLGAGEGLTAVAAVLGFAVGGAIVRWHAVKTRNDPRLQPVVLRPVSPRDELCLS